ncbi:MAG: hypothetical protein AMXMBFR72_10090 [Betaproteobacteria bacterium]|nr:MAG: hypothetical protein BroJett031_26450 [Betaproteobacteria bacterium]
MRTRGANLTQNKIDSAAKAASPRDARWIKKARGRAANVRKITEAAARRAVTAGVTRREIARNPRAIERAQAAVIGRGLDRAQQAEGRGAGSLLHFSGWSAQ